MKGKRWKVTKLPPEELTLGTLEGPKLPCPTEHQEQAMLFTWAEAMSRAYPQLSLMFAIPNFSGTGARGSNVRNINQRYGAKLKREGRKRGVPDVMLPVARGGYHGLFVEMKRVRGSSTTPEQKAWHAALREQGYLVVSCKGAEAAQGAILTYLNSGT